MSATILCYHKVGGALEEGRRLNIEPSRLGSHARFFARMNRRFVTAGELVHTLVEEPVCFTFDDAYASTMVNAPEIFDSLYARATFFAVPGHVGGVSAWDGEAARPLAGWDLLLSVQARGHEVGNHTQTHARLADLPPEGQFDEVASAHRALVDHGLTPGSFCYPYGSLNETAVAMVGMAGYRVGLALGKRPATSDDDPLRLPRIVVSYSDALPMLLYKLLLKPRLRR